MLIAVIPVYNEKRNIGRLLEKLRTIKLQIVYHKIIIVDDGSTDGTAAVVQQHSTNLPVQYIARKENAGPGAAFEQGLSAALRIAKKDDLICTMEADTTSDLGILEEMITRALSGIDVVLASCYSPAGGKIVGTSFDRKFYSFVANILLRIFFPIPNVYTYSSFYRVYRPSVLKRIKAERSKLFTEPGFACMVELLVQLARFPIRVDEVPMVLKCSQRDGASNMKTLKTITGYLRILVRYGIFHRRPVFANRNV